MDLRCLLLALFLLPATTAAVLEDPEGDAGDHLCSPATDLLSFDVTQIDEGYVFEYTFAAALDPEGAMAQDLVGGCFWSYTDFTFQGASQRSDAVYFDHNSNPVYETGWRAYLHETGDDLTIRVDGATIEVELPFQVLGAPGAEPRIGQFRVQVSTSLDRQALTYETDWAPDNSQACDCWVGPNVTSVQRTEPVTVHNAPEIPEQTDDAPSEDVPFGPWTALVAVAGLALLRRQSL